MKVRKTRFILIPKSMDMWFLLHLHFCPIMAQKVTGLKMANFGFKRLFCSSAPRVKNCNLENLKPLVRILWFLFWWFHFSFTEIMLSLMGVLYQMLVEIHWYSNNEDLFSESSTSLMPQKIKDYVRFAMGQCAKERKIRQQELAKTR